MRKNSTRGGRCELKKKWSVSDETEEGDTRARKGLPKPESGLRKKVGLQHEGKLTKKKTA